MKLKTIIECIMLCGELWAAFSSGIGGEFLIFSSGEFLIMTSYNFYDFNASLKKW